ncbi:hypothetical protein BT96DRAFT_880100 [Gymnopus androsaceus JB14]|uniref:Uncharacterized protein n=1 Tax=Gymnopus androsaceus JB14 TaxID=1447944 RepID=A0A6A4HU64_9AGAR|nr:hypothetical protein BT96DRAFT_880100 [Gymnopus androsaceus JB14]
MAYSPDGKQIVSGSDNCQIGILKHPGMKHYFTLSNLQIDDGGWTKLSMGQLILWLPYRHRYGIAHPKQLLTIPADARNHAVQIDATHFAHGTNWCSVWSNIQDKMVLFLPL